MYARRLPEVKRRGGKCNGVEKIGENHGKQIMNGRCF